MAKIAASRGRVIYVPVWQQTFWGNTISKFCSFCLFYVQVFGKLFLPLLRIRITNTSTCIRCNPSQPKTATCKSVNIIINSFAFILAILICLYKCFGKIIGWHYYHSKICLSKINSKRKSILKAQQKFNNIQCHLQDLIFLVQKCPHSLYTSKKMPFV